MEIYWTLVCLSATHLMTEGSSCSEGSSSYSETKFINEELFVDNSCRLQDNIIKHALDFRDMILIKGGDYEVGTNEPVFMADGESPARLVHLDSYYIDVHEVSNQDFADFVKETNYTTDAEKFGNSFVFKGILNNEVKSKISQVVALAPWWMPLSNTSWKFPEGLNSSIKGLI